MRRLELGLALPPRLLELPRQVEKRVDRGGLAHPDRADEVQGVIVVDKQPGRSDEAVVQVARELAQMLREVLSGRELMQILERGVRLADGAPVVVGQLGPRRGGQLCECPFQILRESNASLGSNRL